MENKHTKILIVGLSVVVVMGIALAIGQSIDQKEVATNKVKIPTTNSVQPSSEEEIIETIPCTFSDKQQTYTPQPGDKKVNVSDGLVDFSFMVPKGWLTETRHSGKKEPTIEEMRDFLATNYNGDVKKNPELTSDYADLSWEMLQKMSSEEIKKAYNQRGDNWNPFPAASVSASDYIWYTDTSWKQIDFHILDSFSSQKTLFNDVFVLKNSQKNDLQWGAEVVDGINADVATFATDKDENGKEYISKGGSGGKMYFVCLNQGKDMMVISKQAKGDDQFEEGFSNLIKSLGFNR